MNKYAIVLAAGKGTRMQSLDPEHSKVAYPILGKPIIGYVMDALKPLNFDKVSVVVGFGGEVTKSIVENEVDHIAWQHEILGTGHAVMQTEDFMKDLDGETLIMYGDTPLVSSELIKQIIAIHEKENNDLTVVSAVLPNPHGYGRLIREEKSHKLLAIREETDCSEYELDINEVNTGICVFNNKALFAHLHELNQDNARHLFYLSELVEIFNKDNLKVDTFVAEDMVEVFGINDRIQLAYAGRVIKKRINHKLMLSGVSIEDPFTTFISPDVEIGKDTVICPNTTILGKCVIGTSNEIGPNTYLKDVKIGNDNKILSSWLTDSTIGNNNEIGPFTKMRAGTVLENNCRVGNFVELKDAHFHNGVKCAHLSYLGDSEVGEKTNIGCGTITANYDGFNKTRTSIGHDCFIGSGTIIVAPNTVEDCSFTAAGSTITNIVKTDDMAIARARQVNLEHGYTKFRAKAKAKKEASLKDANH